MKSKKKVTELVADDPQDIAVTLNYMEQAAAENDGEALDNFYAKLQEQCDSFFYRIGGSDKPGVVEDTEGRRECERHFKMKYETPMPI